MTQTGNDRRNQKNRGPLIRTSATVAALVFGLFLVAVLGVMYRTYTQYKSHDYYQSSADKDADNPSSDSYKDEMVSAELKKLKFAYYNNPGNEELKQEIHNLDVQLRREFFQLKNRLHTGIWIMLFAVVGLVASVKTALDYRQKMPRPHSQTADKVVGLLPRWALYTTMVVSMIILAGAITVQVLLPSRLSEESLNMAALKERNRQEEAAMTLAGAEPPVEEEKIEEEKIAEAKIDEEKKLQLRWPRFRSPDGNGYVLDEGYALKWDGASGKNVLWKTPLPLTGASSPVAWGEKVFCTGAAKTGDISASLYCLDAKTGKILWEKEVVTDAGAKGADNIEAFAEYSWAAPTPTTNGKMVVAMFATGDIGAFDFEGNKLWIKHLGVPEMAYGYASSPIFYKDLVIVQWDTDAGAKLIALESKTGEVSWEAKRPDVWPSWATPIVITVDGKDQIVAAGDPWVMGHDPSEKGKILWQADAMGGDIAPSPIYTGKYVIAAYSNGAGTVAIDPTLKGDVTDKLVWEDFDGASEMTSPATDGKIIAQVTYGELYIRDATSKEGKKLYEPIDIGGGTSSSPVIVGDKVYQMGDDGVMHIAQLGQEPKVLDTSPLGEQAWCTPAYVGGKIYIRGSKHVFCIGEKEK